MSCPVCCESYTDSKRRPITCAQCDYDACMQCYKTYLLDITMDPHCMGCRKTWTRQYLGANFPTTWTNGEYKSHRERVLIEREKQLLPDSQLSVANYRHCKRLQVGLPEKRRRVQEIKGELFMLENDIHRDMHLVDRYKATRYRINLETPGDGAGSSKRQRTEFIAPCPTDNCRGFLTGADMTCGVCDAKACTKCGAVMEEDHACAEENVASFKEIKSHSRPCPNCAVPTFKSSGCTQMWCTKCHTTWDWETRAIVRGIIHNPHYFEYLRKHSATGEIPRQPGDEPGGRGRECGQRAQFPHVHQIAMRLQKDMVEEPPRRDALMELIRSINHAVFYDLPRLARPFQQHDNADLRLQFLVNEIDEDEFRTHLQRREKKRDKDLAVRDVLELVRDTAREAMWAYIDKVIQDDRFEQELVALCTYANEQLRSISKQYKMSTNLFKMPAVLPAPSTRAQ